MPVICDKRGLFKVWTPECLRKATHIVIAGKHQFRVCRSCANMLRLRRSTVPLIIKERL